MINEGTGAHPRWSAGRFQNEIPGGAAARIGFCGVCEGRVRVASKADAALALHFSGSAVRIVALDGDARSQRRLASAALLPAARSASLRDHDDDGKGLVRHDADAGGARDLSAVPRVCAGNFDAITCIDGVCGWPAGAADAGAHGHGAQ